MASELMLEELNGGGMMLEEKATMENWAKTRRQKIIMNISFESQVFNIYDPRFSSEEDSPIDDDDTVIDISLIRGKSIDDEEEMEEPDLGEDLQIRSRSSSNPSVAEERDTISLTPNAITPNLSRIMGVCSISKIEQHSN